MLWFCCLGGHQPKVWSSDNLRMRLSNHFDELGLGGKDLKEYRNRWHINKLTTWWQKIKGQRITQVNKGHEGLPHTANYKCQLAGAARGKNCVVITKARTIEVSSCPPDSSSEYQERLYQMLCWSIQQLWKLCPLDNKSEPPAGERGKTRVRITKAMFINVD